MTFISRIKLGIIAVTLLCILDPTMAGAQEANKKQSVGDELLEGFSCLAQVLPAPGKLGSISKTLQTFGDGGERATAVLNGVNDYNGNPAFDIDNPKSGEPALTEETIGVKIDGCTILGTLTSGGGDALKAIVGFQRELLDRFDRAFRFYVRDPAPIRTERLEGCGMSYDQKVCIGFNVGVYRKNELSDIWLRIYNTRVSPDSIGSKAYGNGRIDFNLNLKFGKVTLLGITRKTEILRGGGQVFLSKIKRDKFELLEKNIRKGDVSTKVRVLDKTFIDFLQGEEGHQSGYFIVDSAKMSFPPPPPSITASSKQNKINLSLEGKANNAFQIYRSTSSNFSANNETAIDTIKNTNYTDDKNLVAGRNYYYKAVAVSSSGQVSNPSDEASGQLETSYRFSGLSEDERGRAAYSLDTFSGQLQTLEEEPVPNAEVSLSIPEIELTVDNVQTDENGHFSFQYRVPGREDTYNLRLRARADNGSRIRTLPLAVQARSNWGRDLALASLNLLDSLVVPEEQEILKIGSSITNPGTEREDAQAQYELQDRDGMVDESVPPEEFSLKAGKLESVDKDLSVSSDLDPGSYQLQASVKNKDGLDRKWSNNSATLDVYVVGEQYSAPTYRSTEHQIPGDGSTKTIDGKTVSVVSLSNSSVTFAVGGEETGALPIGGEPQPPWISAAEDFLILEEDISLKEGTPEAPDTVLFQAGGTASGASVSPDRIHDKRGRTEAFEVRVPEGQTLEPSAVTVPYGSDAETLATWESSAEDESPSPKTVALGVEVGASAGLRDYTGWLEWEGSSHSFHKRVKVRPRPIHDLALTNFDVQSTIDGGDQDIPDFIPGAPVEISGTVENRGDFREVDSVEVKVKIDGDGDTEEKIVYTEDVTADLAPRENPDQTSGETQDFSFTWPTVGLPTGSYTVSVEAAHSVDETPGDNRKEKGITLEKPPKVDVVAKKTSGDPFEVGEEIPIRAFAGRGEQPFSEASVSATLIRPTGEEEGLNLKYDSSSQLFETTVYANHGGNYRVEVQAERAPYRPGSDTALVAKTFVDVSASLSSSTVDVGRTRTLRLQTSNVGGLYGASADVVYDEDLLEYVRAAESAFLNEGETVQTTLQAEDRGGKVVTGVTRLDPEKGGVTSTRGGRLLSLGFAGEAPGGQTFALEEVELLDREGEPMATRTVSSSPELTIEEEPAAVSVSLPDTVSSAAGRDTAQVTLTNAYRTETFGGKISFDPSSMRLVDVVESPTLSERGEAKTLFAREIDQEKGTAQFSITRTGDQPGVSVGSAPVAQLIYEPKTSGRSPVVVEKENVVSGREKISLPTLSQNDTLVVAGDDSSGSGGPRIAIDPDTLEATQGDTTSLAVTAEEISGVHSFAGSVAYDSSELTFAGIEEGDFLNTEGRVRTSLNHNTRGDTIMVGLSRLDDGVGGAKTSEKDTLFTVQFLRSGTARSEAHLTKAAALGPNSNPLGIPVDSSLVVAESSPDTTSGTILSFSPTAQTPSLGESFTLAVTAESVTDLFSAATTVVFDSDALDLIGVQEGDFLNDEENVSTSFTRDIDRNAGTIVLGLSRLGADVGGASTEEPDTLFTLQLKKTEKEQSQIELVNTGLLQPDGETEIPFETEPALINAAPVAKRPVPPDTLQVPSPPVKFTNLGGTIFSDPGEDELVFSASSNAPSVIQATETFSNTVTLSPQKEGTAEVTVTASDGLSETDTSFSVTVEERAPAETVPSEEGVAIVESTDGDTVQVGFGNTGASATFQKLQSSGTAKASFYDDGGDSTRTNSFFVPDDPFENVSTYRWKVSGDGVSSESVRLKLALGNSLVEGVQAPKDVVIIRDGEGDGTFEPIETTYDDGGTPIDSSDDVLITQELKNFSTFRLASNNPSNSLGNSPERPDRIGFDVSRNFRDASGPTDHRLVALPGQVKRPLGEAVSGNSGTEWQAFWDNGSSEDYLVKYNGSDTFSFRPGRGFWLTSREEWTLSDSVKTVPLRSDQATAIPLHEGWNIISNPLREGTPWSTVQKANSDMLQPAWAFAGSFQQADTLRSAATGQAYYFLNNQGLDSLSVPYPTTVKAQDNRTLDPRAGIEGAEEGASMTLVAAAEDSLQSKIQAGISPEAASGLGPRDVVAPPARFSALSLRLKPHGDTPARKHLLATEWRPPPNEAQGKDNGHTFSLRLQSTTSGPVEVRAKGLRDLKERQVALLAPASGQSWDLREKESVTLRETDSTALKLAVGSAAYVQDREQQVTPNEVTLTSYPNPMRGQATIEYTLTERSDVRVSVYDVLGRRVAILANGLKEAGRHKVQFDGGHLASGVYFGRLETGGEIRTQKITVVR